MSGEHGEAFPREETTELVGEALRVERRRAWIQDLLIALALALLALGLPTERLLVKAPSFVSERTGFLASGIAFATGWLVLARAARRNGWESGAALRASFAAAALPPVLLAGTTPGSSALAWLGGCLAAALATVEARRLVRALGWSAAILCVAAALPSGWLSSAALAPLAWLGVLELEKRGRRTRWVTAAALVLGVLVLGWVRWTDPERAWRARAEEQLDPRDLVLTASTEHAYLLGRRYGIQTFGVTVDPLLVSMMSATRAAGGRVVLDETELRVEVRDALAPDVDALLTAR